MNRLLNYNVIVNLDNKQDLKKYKVSNNSIDKLIENKKDKDTLLKEIEDLNSGFNLSSLEAIQFLQIIAMSNILKLIQYRPSDIFGSINLPPGITSIKVNEVLNGQLALVKHNKGDDVLVWDPNYQLGSTIELESYSLALTILKKDLVRPLTNLIINRYLEQVPISRQNIIDGLCASSISEYTYAKADNNLIEFAWDYTKGYKENYRSIITKVHVASDIKRNSLDGQAFNPDVILSSVAVSRLLQDTLISNLDKENWNNSPLKSIGYSGIRFQIDSNTIEYQGIASDELYFIQSYKVGGGFIILNSSNEIDQYIGAGDAMKLEGLQIISSCELALASMPQDFIIKVKITNWDISNIDH